MVIFFCLLIVSVINLVNIVPYDRKTECRLKFIHVNRAVGQMAIGPVRSQRKTQHHRTEQI